MTPLPLDPQAVPLVLAEGKVYRVAGTRVSLDAIVRAYNLGESAESIVDGYPSLRLRDVYAVIAYYLDHRAAVDEYVAQSEARETEIRVHITSHPDYQQWRERLLARRVGAK